MPRRPKTTESLSESSAGQSNERTAGGRDTKSHRRPRIALHVTLTILLWVFFALAVVLTLTEIWLFNTWSALDIDEIVYHLKVSLEGTNSDMIFAYLSTYGLAAVAIVAAGSVAAVLLRKNRRAFLLLVCGLSLGSVVSLGWAFHDLDARTGLFDYLSQGSVGIGQSDNDDAADDGDDFISAHYVDPSGVHLEFPEQRRNLVYLFLESMEITFADKNSGGAFEYNCIPELTTLAQENEDFSGGGTRLGGAISLPGSTWTSGAMFAQTSGLPLKLPLDGNSMEGTDEFFPQIRTLGDILAEQGYNQTLLIGSKAAFGGRDSLFRTHGGYEVYDYDHAVAVGDVPPDYYVWWGFEDERLFTIARRRMTELAEAGAPFNLTMLTADTHFEDGYLCGLCGDEFGDNQYANVMSCSSRQVVSLVEWMRAQSFWDNTTVVICGDHPTMDSDFCDGVSPDYQRRTYMTVINAPLEPRYTTKRRSYSTMDLFPTTLAALGVQVEGERLGLGTNLFSGQSTLIEGLGLDEVTDGLSGQSTFLIDYSGLSITPRDLFLAVTLRRAELQPRVALGNEVSFLFGPVSRINRDSLTKVTIEATSLRTHTMTSYNMSVLPSRSDPNVFVCEARLPIAWDDLDDYRFEVFAHVGGVERYCWAHFEPAVSMDGEAVSQSDVMKEGDEGSSGGNGMPNDGGTAIEDLRSAEDDDVTLKDAAFSRVSFGHEIALVRGLSAPVLDVGSGPALSNGGESAPSSGDATVEEQLPSRDEGVMLARVIFARLSLGRERGANESVFMPVLDVGSGPVVLDDDGSAPVDDAKVEDGSPSEDDDVTLAHALLARVSFGRERAPEGSPFVPVLEVRYHVWDNVGSLSVDMQPTLADVVFARVSFGREYDSGGRPLVSAREGKLFVREAEEEDLSGTATGSDPVPDPRSDPVQEVQPDEQRDMPVEAYSQGGTVGDVAPTGE